MKKIKLWQVAEIDHDIEMKAKGYLIKNLPKYDLVAVVKKSNIPGDENLYIVVAKYDDTVTALPLITERYTVWTCCYIGDDRTSFNHGVYDLSNLESCESVIIKNSYDGDEVD